MNQHQGSKHGQAMGAVLVSALLAGVAAGCEMGLDSGPAGAFGGAADGSVATIIPAPTEGEAGTQGTSDPELEPGKPQTADPGDVDQDDPTRARCDDEEGFEAVAPRSYVARVKRLLSVEGVTDEELALVRDDPSALEGLISGWLQSEASTPKLLDFFRTAFQQDEMDGGDLRHQFGTSDRMGLVAGVSGPSLPQRGEAWIQMSFQESFARTALHIVRSGRAFTEVMTTDEFMLNTPLMVLLAWNDQRVLEDGSLYYPDYGEMEAEIPSVSYVRTQVPILDTLDPNNVNFMKFAYPADALDCLSGEDTVREEEGNPVSRRYLDRAINAVFGSFSKLGSGCPHATTNAYGMFDLAEWTDWRLVRVRRPSGSERSHRFYEVEDFRASNELVLHTPRVGFFTTPAFFAVWPTNGDNSSRVTLNQTLIAGLGYSIEAAAGLAPELDGGLDGEHAGVGTSCYGCHVLLDPMRNFFRREYTDQASRQTNASMFDLPANIYLSGSPSTEAQSIEEFAQVLSRNEKFASAWVQKLCFYATNRACPTDSEEFARIATAFEESGFDFNVLVSKLLSSPLTTGASCVQAGGGDAPGIARRRFFCEALSTRLGIEDACFAMETRGRGTTAQQEIATIKATIPDDTYSRGIANPLMISDSNLFVNGAYERICETMAPLAVAAGGAMDASNTEQAVRAAVETLMAVPPSDALHDGLITILQEHYDAAVAQSGDSGLAMQSVFVTACLSPAVAGTGL